MSRRFSWAVALACMTFLAVAATPASAQWRPVQRQCLAGSALVTGCVTVPGFGGVWNVAVSPDGRTAYTTSLKTAGKGGRGSIHVFTRNPATGTLALKPGADGCITHVDMPVTGCAQARAIGRADEIMISADGRFVYVASQEAVDSTPNALAGAVAVFRRNTTTGVLTQLPGTQGCINDDATEGCLEGHAIGGTGAVLSNDQRNIYVLGRESLAVLRRNTTDGTLSQPDGACFGLSGSGDNCEDTNPRPGGRQLALSGDGKQLYTPAGSNVASSAPGFGGLRIFVRNTTTGALTRSGCITQGGNGTGCVRAPGIGLAPQNLVISPDSKNVYLSHVDGITTFARNANGALVFRSCINDPGNTGCANSSNVSNLGFMAVSPDGQDVVAVPQGGAGGFAAFARNGSTGALTRRPGRDGCLTPDGSGFDNGAAVPNACRAASGMSLFGHIRFFGNGLIYVGFFGGDRIAVVKRDFYPVCRGRSVTVRRNRAKRLPLACSDRNGDAIARTILQPPGAGTLGAINQGNGNVIYSPFTGFTGNDSFSFRATAGGLTSAPAAIDITIAKRAKGIRGVSLSYAYLSFSDHTQLTKLVLKKVPRGSKVRAVCTFKGRRCAGKASRPFTKKRARGTVSLAKRFVGVDLKVGSRITVTVTKKGLVGAANVVTIRARKAPKIVSRCLKPNSKKLRKRC